MRANFVQERIVHLLYFLSNPNCCQNAKIKSCCLPRNSLYHHGFLDGVWFSWLAIKSATTAITFIIFHRCSLTIQGSSFPSTENNKANRKIGELIQKKSGAKP